MLIFRSKVYLQSYFHHPPDASILTLHLKPFRNMLLNVHVMQSEMLAC